MQTAKVLSSSTQQQQRNQLQSKVLMKAKHLHLSSEQNRLDTFTNWPPSTGVAPIQLARAGFFYTGKKDSCRCFYCDGGLKNWEPKDEPFMEHARWFPTCEWIIRQRGRAYVEYVNSNFPKPGASANRNKEKEKHENTDKDRDKEDKSKDKEDKYESKNENKDKPCTIKHCMESDIVKTVLDMGYSPNVIEAILMHKLTSTNTFFENTYSFLEYIFEYQDEFKRQNNDQQEVGEVTANIDCLHLQEPKSKATNKRPIDEPPPDIASYKISSHAEKDLTLQLEQLRDRQLCKLCMTEDMNTVFLKCNHMVACLKCSEALKESICPVCRSPIERVLHIFKT